MPFTYPILQAVLQDILSCLSNSTDEDPAHLQDIIFFFYRVDSDAEIKL
jgi:hypothetical protein